MKSKILLIGALTLSAVINAQTIEDIYTQVEKDNLITMIKELDGETSTTINGEETTITHREDALGNDLAADYLKEKFNEISNITVEDIHYNENGRNIIATQLGTETPENIYIICAHYDTVHLSPGADDNASGVSAVIEATRIISQYETKNTIVYALWDQEEDGPYDALGGSVKYAENARALNKNIIGVLNLDMIGYDGDDDENFDIDLITSGEIKNDYPPVPDSSTIKNDILEILSESDINLVANVVDPGTYESDHDAFWRYEYKAVLMGESWENDDQTIAYHNPNDKTNIMDFDYLTKMTQLSIAYIATKADIVRSLNNNEIIKKSFSTSPNPAKDYITVNFKKELKGKYKIVNNTGKTIKNSDFTNCKKLTIPLKNLKKGIYFISIYNSEIEETQKIIIE